MNKVFLLVVGSRGITDYAYVRDYLDNFIRENYLGYRINIVSGGARGVDSLAERYADERCYEKVIMPADWHKYGKSAGYRRNEAMHRFIALQENKHVIAFWDGVSKGTAHNFELAKIYGNPIVVDQVGGVQQKPFFDPVRL